MTNIWNYDFILGSVVMMLTNRQPFSHRPIFIYSLLCKLLNVELLDVSFESLG